MPNKINPAAEDGPNSKQTSSLSTRSYGDLQAAMRRRQAALAEVHRASPAAFRRCVRQDDDPRPIDEQLCDWQRADFEALDAAWMRVVDGGASNRSRLAPRGVASAATPDEARADESRTSVSTRPLAEREGYGRAWIERQRGHAKTSDTAAMVAWALVAADRPITGLAAAADREQAQLLRRAIGRLVAANPRLQELKVCEDKVVNVVTRAEMRVISSDAASSYGELVDFIICDELCHWGWGDVGGGEAVWHSLISTAAKKPGCLLIVLTNAGVGRGWQWDAREAARTSPGWYFSSLDGAKAPWITKATLDEQRRLLPEAVFNRLWLNRWQHSDGEFVTLAEAEACRDESLSIRSRGRPGVAYVAAVDYGEKRDFTAAIICHREGSRVVVDRLDVAVPTPQLPVPVAWVEDWIERQAVAFPGLRVVVDEHQLVGVAQRWSGRLPVERFAFAGGAGNHLLALTLRRMIVGGEVAWYAGCGDVTECSLPRLPSDSAEGECVPSSKAGLRDDLETELSSLILRQSSSGRIRFDHTAGRHDDRAFVLAVACLKLSEGPGEEWMSVGAM